MTGMTSAHVDRERALHAAAQDGRWTDVAVAALELYADEWLGYLVALTRDQAVADDVFGQLLEDLWAGLPAFRWDCSLRTWSYALARNALHRSRRNRRRTVPLDDRIEELATQARSRTATFLRTESRDRFAAIRARLDRDAQSLLILRINRGMSWRDIARVLPDPDGDADAAAITRRAAALRKQFERLKSELRAELRPGS
jgi:RNA polymerase sigma-70 factor (ECF subfamily)